MCSDLGHVIIHILTVDNLFNLFTFFTDMIYIELYVYILLQGEALG